MMNRVICEMLTAAMAAGASLLTQNASTAL